MIWVRRELSAEAQEAVGELLLIVNIDPVARDLRIIQIFGDFRGNLARYEGAAAFADLFGGTD